NIFRHVVGAHGNHAHVHVLLGICEARTYINTLRRQTLPQSMYTRSSEHTVFMAPMDVTHVVLNVVSSVRRRPSTSLSITYVPLLAALKMSCAKSEHDADQRRTNLSVVEFAKVERLVERTQRRGHHGAARATQHRTLRVKRMQHGRRSRVQRITSGEQWRRR